MISNRILCSAWIKSKIGKAQTCKQLSDNCFSDLTFVLFRVTHFPLVINDSTIVPIYVSHNLTSKVTIFKIGKEKKIVKRGLALESNGLWPIKHDATIEGYSLSFEVSCPEAKAF